MSPRFAAIAAALEAGDHALYYDVSPLFEEHWTGIPVVAAGLARALLRWLPGSVHFFFEHHRVARAAVIDALGRQSGLFLNRDFFRGPAQDGRLPPLEGRRRAIGLYPSVKRVTQIFPLECSLYHDLSTLITPHFHVIENIRHHQKGLVDDLRTNALTFGVSQATVDDLKAYLGAPEDRVFVAHNGVSWPDWYAVQAPNMPVPFDGDPYFLVLSTREPRKNIGCVFELLALFPEILETTRVVIAGRAGWLLETQSPPAVLAKALAEGRLVFPGFVSDFDKYLLLRGAEATIYPSFFEGFGLPILESLSAGTPVIASFSSSLPEIGHEACLYFDPFSPESLYRVVREVQENPPKRRAEFMARARAITARFSWDNMLLAIMEPLAAYLAGHTSLPKK
jgi:glycosyltransferase involved in cell wall biosynthesis